MLLFDVHYLAHRAFFSTGHLSHEDVSTGVVFGIFRDIAQLQNQFGTSNVVFCFDSKFSVRKELYPEYKSSRKRDKWDEDQIAAWKEMVGQINKMRKETLHEIGYRNVFVQRGYEADDIIGSICQTYPNNKIVIVSADSDMFQLLTSNISIWNPRKGYLFTKEQFERRYNVHPTIWPEVKSISGDSSDNIPGAQGVGIKTAVKYLNGDLKLATKANQAIRQLGKQYEVNLKLIQIPYEGTQDFHIKKNRLSGKRWNKVLRQFGIKSLQLTTKDELRRSSGVKEETKRKSWPRKIKRGRGRA